MPGVIVDLFSGAGGASLGIKRALGREPDIVVDRDHDMIRMHRVNHPRSHHIEDDVLNVDPRKIVDGRDVDLLWASPDCRHFSTAKGGRQVSEDVRSLPWVIPRWLEAVRPKVFIMENVSQFRTWGRLSGDRPDPQCIGETFFIWVEHIRRLGYDVEIRDLAAHHYGVPTHRRRIFAIGRCDGKRIVWPKQTHGPGLTPYCTAAECIDWSVECSSIFGRDKPLSEATLRRIARGFQRFVLDNAEPFVMLLTHHGGDRVYGVQSPTQTITAARELCLLAPTLVQVSFGERKGQAPRCMNADAPLGTVPAGGVKHALAVAHLMQAYGGNYHGAGSSMRAPLPTITTCDHNHLVTTQLSIVKDDDRSKDVRAFLSRYLGAPPQLGLPISARDRLGIVSVLGADYAIVDIGFRRLEPRELFRAQGFPDSYIIDRDAEGMAFTKTQQVKAVGNSVCPPVAEALVRANVDP